MTGAAKIDNHLDFIRISTSIHFVNKSVKASIKFNTTSKSSFHYDCVLNIEK